MIFNFAGLLGFAIAALECFCHDRGLGVKWRRICL